MDDKIKVLILPILFLAILIACVILLCDPAIKTYEAWKQNGELQEKYEGLQVNLEGLKKQQEQQNNVELEGSKVVYENSEFNFSKEASFAPLIEKFIDIAKFSGVRIHSIDYNYSPADDLVFIAQTPGYNVCELSVTAVGHYNNFQKLFSTIIADTNIMNLASIDIAPWEANNSVLVGKFKLRLYTKTM